MNIQAAQRLLINLDIKVAQAVIEQHVAASPYVVGKELAQQIDAYARKQHLGYYPALAFFYDVNEVEEELINAAESIAWLLENLLREALLVHLRSHFTGIQIESVHPRIFNLPPVRPTQNNALHELAAHFTPDHVRVTLSGFLKQAPVEEAALIDAASCILNKALKGRFAMCSVSSVQTM